MQLFKTFETLRSEGLSMQFFESLVFISTEQATKNSVSMTLFI